MDHKDSEDLLLSFSRVKKETVLTNGLLLLDSDDTLERLDHHGGVVVLVHDGDLDHGRAGQPRHPSVHGLHLQLVEVGLLAVQHANCAYLSW